MSYQEFPEKLLLIRSLQGDLHNCLNLLDSALGHYKKSHTAELRFDLLTLEELLSKGAQKVEKILG